MLDGQHAVRMGAPDLKEGDRIRQMVEWEVKRHSKTTESGKTNYSMVLCLNRVGDMEECDSEKESEDESNDEGGVNPALAFIEERARGE